MIYLIHVTEKRVGKATILAIHKPAQVHAVAWSNDIHPFVLQDADLSKADVQDRFGYFIAGCFANCIILGNWGLRVLHYYGSYIYAGMQQKRIGLPLKTGLHSMDACYLSAYWALNSSNQRRNNTMRSFRLCDIRCDIDDKGSDLAAALAEHIPRTWWKMIRPPVNLARSQIGYRCPLRRQSKNKYMLVKLLDNVSMFHAIECYCLFFHMVQLQDLMFWIDINWTPEQRYSGWSQVASIEDMKASLKSLLDVGNGQAWKNVPLRLWTPVDAGYNISRLRRQLKVSSVNLQHLLYCNLYIYMVYEGLSAKQGWNMLENKAERCRKRMKVKLYLLRFSGAAMSGRNLEPSNNKPGQRMAKRHIGNT